VLREDAASFFMPMYAFLGDRLRSFDIPGWNPYTLSGAPFAGDPESGWMYLPAMIFFALLPPVPALTGFAVFHLLLAGLGAYALGRVLGLGVAGAMVAGVAYQFSPFVEGATCCSIRTQVASWLPLALIGVELALRGGGWRRNAAWWGVAGLAISQILAGWLGQGAYYGLLVIGAYVVFRTVISPPMPGQRVRVRLATLALHGTAILAIGFGLAAAGVLPRIEATDQSNLAGGVYQGTAAEKAATGGWPPVLALDRVLSAEDGQARWYIGAAVFALAVVAPFVARQRSPALFFASVSAAFVVLTLDPTPLHRLLYLLPRFQALHEHVPNRALLGFFLGPSILAGMTVDAIVRPTSRTRLLASVVLLPPLLVTASGVVLASAGRTIGLTTYIVVFAASALLGVAAVLGAHYGWRGRLAGLGTTVVIPALLLGLVFWDPAGQEILRVARDGVTPPRVPAYLRNLPCLDTRADGAARVLQRKGKQGPFRYFGFDPRILDPPDGPPDSYRRHLDDKTVQNLLVANQSICLGLDDVQGYNPVQSARYVAYMTALNGREQEYHASNVLLSGLTSPLLDALNARYLVVPADAPVLQRKPLADFPTVYVNARVTVLERPAALPRAWIVQEGRQVTPEEALTLLGSPAVDLRQTALLEVAPPPLASPRTSRPGRVTVTADDPDRIEARVTAAGAGLLVLSEVYDPAWRAYVNGAPAPLFAADYVLRAVPVPAGESTVVFRYESPMLRLGIAISALTVSVFLGLGISALWQWRGRASAPQ
jgi:hypothetical protein